MRWRIGPSLREDSWLAGGKRGTVSVWLLLALPVFLGLVGLAVDGSRLWKATVDMRASTDAASLAAVQVFVNDQLLTGDPAVMVDLIRQARQEAINYAYVNPVLGEPLVLDPNLANAPDGDIVFGVLETPRSPNFVLADQLEDPQNAMLKYVNTLRVTGRRTHARGNPAALFFGRWLNLAAADVQITATATLDRQVIGFRPVGSTALPLMPLALLSDPSGTLPQSWEFQVEKRGGGDRYRFDRALQRAVSDPNGDGLAEMKVTLMAGGGQAGGSPPNSCVLFLGIPAGDGAGVCRQIRFGLAPADFTDLGGQLVLPEENRLTVSGAVGGQTPPTVDLIEVHKCLEQLQLRGEARIWPLFSGFDPNNGLPSLSGFVAARVVHVEPMTQAGMVSFTIQPCMVASPAAVTDASRRSRTGGILVNPYICKVRLVE